MINTKNIDIDDFKTLLKKHHLKATPQRIAVHEAMMKLGHASANMVADDIKKESDTYITVTSVYNILSNLADLGIYEHRLSSDRKMYFDVNTSRHIHIYDSENHTYKDIFDDKLMDLIQEYISHRHFKGYSIDNVDIQIIARPTRHTKRKKQI